MRLASPLAPVVMVLLLKTATAFSARSLLLFQRFSRFRMCSSSPGSGISKKKLVFLGTPDVAARSFELLVDASKQPNSLFDVVAAVTQPPAPAGRNKKLTPSPVQIAAEKQGISVFIPEKAKDPEFLEELAKLAPDVCITAAYGNFLPTKFLNIPKYGTLNIHPSLLPKYRGAAPVQRCLESGDSESGVSVVFTVLKMDAGPIVRQHIQPLGGDEKAPEFLLQMFEKGTALLLEALPSVFDGSVKSVVRQQVDEDATPADKLSPADARVDFSQLSAKQVHNRMRGYAIWPGIWSTFTIVPAGGDATATSSATASAVAVADAQRIKIISTVLLEAAPGSLPLTNDVTAIRVGKQDILQVVCGDGSVLGITELQAPSKKAMKVRDFLNGYRGGVEIKWTVPPAAEVAPSSSSQ